MKQLLFVTGKIFSFFIILGVIASGGRGSAAAQNQNDYAVFLPAIFNGSPEFSTQRKFIGIYMQQYWNDQTVSQYMPQADNLAGKKHSVSGWFIDIQDTHFINPPARIQDHNLYRQLEALWQQGYISFVNVNSTASAYAIASGEYNTYLRRLADVYAAWVSLGGGRRAFIAPLPEMNGVGANGIPWASYGGDAENFKIVYQLFQTIFSQKGIRPDQVWWVFAPNGWSTDGHEFEKYYPGDTFVNVIGFSSYNYGFCRVAIPWQGWENFDSLFTPYLERIALMAPTKPIILAQTGTTSEYSTTGVTNVAAKNSWLGQNYDYLSQQPQVLGILYYDFDQSGWECNWRILPGSTYTGYRDGASNAEYLYLSSQALRSIIP